MKTSHRSRAWRVATGAAALCASALPWQPALAEHSISAAAQVCQLDRYSSVFCDSDTAFGTDGTVTYQAELPGQQAYASQSFGVFKGSADLSLAYGSVLVTQRSFGIQNVATGKSVDNWVLSGGTGQGYLRFTWSIDGTTSAFVTTNSPGNAGVYSDAYMNMDAHVRAQTSDGFIVSSEATTGFIRGGSGSCEMSGPVTFFFDQPVEVIFFSSVVAALGTTEAYGGSLFGGEAHADFSHTAILSGIQAYDLNGKPLSGVTISAESGTHYPLSPVPEPESVALMAAGLGALAWRRRATQTGQVRSQLPGR